MKLYELTGEQRALEEKLEALLTESGGELDDETDALETEIDGLGTQIEIKAQSIRDLIVMWEAELEAAAIEGRRVAAVKKATERQISWCTSYLDQQMQERKITEIAIDVGVVKFRKAQPKPEVIDQKDIPMRFLVPTPASWSPDLRAITDHFKKTGDAVSGVKMLENRHTMTVK